mmetsp:Transcript_16393/g.35612  ORF Transcript_16393/g.35612 Transcript_16393/m.35612 type:complete len:498 (+) Transcript_16393:217-1710(+)
MRIFASVQVGHGRRGSTSKGKKRTTSKKKRKDIFAKSCKSILPSPDHDEGKNNTGTTTTAAAAAAEGTTSTSLPVKSSIHPPLKHMTKPPHVDSVTEPVGISHGSILNSSDASTAAVIGIGEAGSMDCNSGSSSNNNTSNIDTDKRTNRTAAHIDYCRSLASGWCYPETGVIVICGESSNQSTRQNAHADVLEPVEGKDWSISYPPHESPFCNPLTDSTCAEKGSISAEGLLDRIRLGAAGGVTEHVHGKLLNSHNSTTYYGKEQHLKFLEDGGAFYSFTCRTWMTPYEREMVKTIANMTGFADETRDNRVPAFDVDNPDDVRKYTFVLQKSAYLLPGVQLSIITPELLSGTYYHTQCQPSGTKMWKQTDPNTFRFTRPIVPHVYNMTVQFTVSKVGRAELDALTKVMGVRVDHGILMERTKRSYPPKVDGTAKAKSILCYTAVPGGVLVTHSTVILNTAIARVVAGVIHTFGSMGLQETCETAERTRGHLLDLVAK